MIESVIIIAYIAVFCLCIGVGIWKILGRFLELPDMRVTRLVVTGVIALTVIVGWVSIFTHIGVGVHVFLLLITVAGRIYSRRELQVMLSEFHRGLKWQDYFTGICFVLIIAYATSRGAFHTDTGIYHAAAIRLYEEYGIVRGIANLQLHYGYNSSYLGFAALFTLSGILPNAAHATTGFLMTIFGLDAVYHLRDIRSHRYHYADAVRTALLLYILMNYTGAMSPATDYGTMLMTGYFLCEWADCAGAGIGDRDYLGLLSVYGLYLTTMKLSAAMCTIVVVLPLVYMIRKKEIKKLLGFIALGLACFAFYPVRNVILSGWLFYPFESIDLFNVEWKVPVEYSLVDSAQIKVWGRCLYDVDKLDWGLSKWLPIWWEAQEHYDQMLIYGCLLGVVLIGVTFILRLVHAISMSREVPGVPRSKSQGNVGSRGHHSINMNIRPAVVVMYVMITANICVWFFSAPFVRYGLIFLLALPMLAIAGFWDSFRPGRFMPGGAVVILVIICYFARIDHYVMDDLVYIRHNIAGSYYIAQQPFDASEMGVEYMGESGIPVYYTTDDREINSYYTPPSTCYRFMLDRTELIGSKVEDGFRSR